LTFALQPSKIRHVAKIKSLLSLLLLLSLFVVSPSSNAAAAEDEVKWTRVNIPTEGKAGNWVLADDSDTQHLVMAPDGTLYAYGKDLSYTLYKSTDDGYSWSYLSTVSDNIVAIAIAPDEDNTIYYATSSNVYKSTNGGKKFKALPANPGGAGSNNIEITSLAVARLESNIIAAATRDTDNAQFGGIYLLDEAQMIPAWVNAALGNYDAYAVAFSPNYPADRQLVAVVTDETNTYVTTKIGTAGWGTTTGNARLDKDNSGIPTSIVVTNSAAIAFPSDYDASSADYNLFIAIDAGSDDGDVYKITPNEAPGNSSATDLNIGADYGLSNVDVTGLAVDGNGNDAILLAGAAHSAQIYSSTDGGRGWAKSRKEPTGSSRTYVLIAPDFSSSGKAYVATSGNESAISISRDSGITWNQIGLIDTAISNIIDLAPSPRYLQDSTLFMLTFGGEYSLWRSLDGGTIWERTFASTLPSIDSLNLVELSAQYGSQVVYLAGSSNGLHGIWKSVDNGQNFSNRPAFDPTSGASLTIYSWAAVNDATLFIGSHDGSNGLVYLTTNSGFSYSDGAPTGNQTLTSIVLSPNYGQDGAILAGDSGGWVYWSDDNGASFKPLPPDAASPPLTGAITVAFDPNFSKNNIVYAASNAADKGAYRLKIGTDHDWERIDSILPTGGTLSQVIVSSDGTLYAANSQTDGGLERSLNPTYSLGPTFETVTRGLSENAMLSGLWWHDYRLWSIDTIHTKLLTFNDSLTSPVTLTSPSNDTAGIGILMNYTINNVSLDWEAMSGATEYQWQLDYDTDFSIIPSGFEGNTKASSTHLPALEPATTYYWRVRVSEPVLSPWSAKWSFATSLDTETATIKLESPKAGTTGVSIKPLFQWNAVTGADAYELLVSTDIQFSHPLIVKSGAEALPTTAWQADISLSYDTTYYWKVRALGASTYSAWSAASSFSTELPPPPAIPLAATPPIILPVPIPPQAMPPVLLPPASPPPLLLPPPAQSPSTPDWVIFLISALFLVIVLLIITILVLAIGIRHA
jgi:hypothetical protein